MVACLYAKIVPGDIDKMSFTGRDVVAMHIVWLSQLESEYEQLRTKCAAVEKVCALVNQRRQQLLAEHATLVKPHSEKFGLQSLVNSGMDSRVAHAPDQKVHSVLPTLEDVSQWYVAATLMMEMGKKRRQRLRALCLPPPQPEVILPLPVDNGRPIRVTIFENFTAQVLVEPVNNFFIDTTSEEKQD